MCSIRWRRDSSREMVARVVLSRELSMAADWEVARWGSRGSRRMRRGAAGQFIFLLVLAEIVRPVTRVRVCVCQLKVRLAVGNSSVHRVPPFRVDEMTCGVWRVGSRQEFR